jgi:hypothetical protein
MINPAYLVEGDMEQDFIQSICPGAPVQKIGCNGHTVSVEAIAKRVGTLGRMLQRRCSPIVVIFDREERPLSALELEGAFLTAVQKEGITATLIIGIPDRDIEAWILADLKAFAESAGISLPQNAGPFEGTKGKSGIKALLPAGKSYVKTMDGVKWLKNANPAEIAKQSPSFLRLQKQLTVLECWWLQRLL